MAQLEAADKKSFSLEEDEMVSPLFGAAAPGVGVADYDATERSAEQALLSVIKIMYIKAGHKLAQAQQRHYMMKYFLATSQQTFQSAPQILSLLYYVEVLNVMSSAYTIQRQDAWNTWLIYEMLETEVFGNVYENVPEDFHPVMAQAQVNAMTTYYHEASTDLQLLYLEQYLQMLGAPVVPHPTHNAAAASFLEEEATAEPNKPFFPFMGMGMGAMNPQIMTYYASMMRYYSVMLNYQAAEGLYHNAILEQKALNGEENKFGAQIKTYAVGALQQWAYINMMQIFMQFQSMGGLMGMSGGFGHNNAAAAAANSFVQTEAAPTAPVANELTEEQRAALETAVNQFLRPQPILSQPAAQ